MSDETRQQAGTTTTTNNNTIYRDFSNGMKIQSRDHLRLAGEIARRSAQGISSSRNSNILYTAALNFSQLETNLENIENNLNKIPNVDIDPSGKFKYILIQVKDPESKAEKHIVRGYKSCAYHADIYDLVEPVIENQGCKAKCIGGGRIRHDPSVKSIFIYGYSQGFGKADHTITHKLVKEKYPNYNDIQWSNEGY